MRVKIRGPKPLEVKHGASRILSRTEQAAVDILGEIYLKHVKDKFDETTTTRTGKLIRSFRWIPKKRGSGARIVSDKLSVYKLNAGGLIKALNAKRGLVFSDGRRFVRLQSVMLHRRDFIARGYTAALAESKHAMFLTAKLQERWWWSAGHLDALSRTLESFIGAADKLASASEKSLEGKAPKNG